MRPVYWLGYLVLFVFSFSSSAESAFVERPDVQQYMKLLVKKYHFNPRELKNNLSQVKIQPQLIQSMEQPFEKKNWDVYRAIFLTPQRIQGGLDFWQANQKVLAFAEKKYGVPKEIIIAILGVETLYGERQGNYRILDALGTLAFDYPKRSPFFTEELTQYLLLCREQKVTPTTYKGSYAGAIGKPQFMPSNYRKFAVDYANKGFRDLVNNNADSIISIANYLHHHGWEPYKGIAQPVHVAGTRYKHLTLNPRRANYSYQQLLAAGVRPITMAHNHPQNAGLFEYTLANGNEFWLGYTNFFVIMRYNSSPQYALAVYLLSQQLKQAWNEHYVTKHRAYV